MSARDADITAACRWFFPYGTEENQLEMGRLLRQATNDLTDDLLFSEAVDVAIKEVERNQFSAKRLRDVYRDLARNRALEASAENVARIASRPGERSADVSRTIAELRDKLTTAPERGPDAPKVIAPTLRPPQRSGYVAKFNPGYDPDRAREAEARLYGTEYKWLPADPYWREFEARGNQA